MPINASYEYLNAEKKYNQAQTLDEKITTLEEMLRTSPSHKGAENLRADLRARLKKLLEKKEKSKKTGKTTHTTLKKEGFQCVLIGLPNSGKSSLLAALTNAHPQISPVPFATSAPELGTLDFQGIKAQIVELPALTSENFDIGIANTADCLILVIEKLADLEQLEQRLAKAHGRRIIVINKADLLSDEQARKLEMTLKSRRLPALLVSAFTGSGIDALKERIIQEMHIIRVYTKEPGKTPSKIPVVLPEGSTVKNVAESILHGFSARIRETRITGPSSKFPNQKVGLSHILKDSDIVEFHTS